jgi:hypothetical protein
MDGAIAGHGEGEGGRKRRPPILFAGRMLDGSPCARPPDGEASCPSREPATARRALWLGHSLPSAQSPTSRRRHRQNLDGNKLSAGGGAGSPTRSGWRGQRRTCGDRVRWHCRRRRFPCSAAGNGVRPRTTPTAVCSCPPRARGEGVGAGCGCLHSVYVHVVFTRENRKTSRGARRTLEFFSASLHLAAKPGPWRP